MELSPPRLPAAVPARDLRIDLLKGVALAMILVDHLDDLAGVRGLSRWTLRALGPSDAADLFMLLSGLVVGRSCAARIDRLGWLAAQWRVMRQTLVLYLSLMSTSVVMMALFALTGTSAERFLRSPGPMAESWSDQVIGQLTLQRIPYVMHILAVYIVLLPFAPTLVALLRRNLVGGLLPMAALYLWVQCAAWRPDEVVALPAPRWYFNPWAWQFLFALGLLAGSGWSRRADAPLFSRTTAARRWLGVLCCSAVMIGGWLLRPDVTSGVEPLLDARWSRPALTLLVDKRIAGPLRMVHAVATASLAVLVLPPRWSRDLPVALCPVAACGRFSLRCYLGGVLLTCGAWIAIQSVGNDLWTVVCLEIDALVLLAMAATLWSRRANPSQARLQA